jgi:cell division protein FtsQ
VRIGLCENVFTADLGEARARLRAQPWIASADAHRVLPNTIVVDIREHVPAAVVELPSGDAYLADAAGRPFKRITGTEGDGFPRVTGIDRDAYRADPSAAARQVVSALEVLASWRAGERPAVDEVHLDGRGTALRHGELTIHLGPAGDIAARLKTFDLVWTALGTDERSRVRRIHLDARLDHVTVAFAST